MLTQCEASVSSDKVNRWVLKCIKRHGGPYEIPEKCKQTWTMMKEFLEKNVFDSKISESKRKGCIIQGLLSCCLTMESSLNYKVEEITQLQKAVDNSNNVCERLQNQSDTETVNLKLHAVTIGEALLEKSKHCDELSEENERLKLRIMELEKRSQECRYASNLGFSNLQQTEPHIKSDNSLPAAPTVTTTVYNNNNNTGEVQLVMKPLRSKELDAILKEIGMVPYHDLNRFLKWFCDVQQVRDMYNLNPSDLERVLQHSVGSGLWMRIKQICIQPLRTRDILLELLCVLYGVRSDVTIHGKIQQMQNESPYELSHRIATIMELLVGNNLAFERGGLIHMSMFLDALHEDIKQNILLVTPNPHDLKDILLRADHLWRKSNEQAVKIDLATLFRTNTEHKDQKIISYDNTQRGHSGSNIGDINMKNRADQNNNKKRSKTWIPFSHLKQKYDHLKIEYDKMRGERDKLLEQLKGVQGVMNVQDVHSPDLFLNADDTSLAVGVN